MREYAVMARGCGQEAPTVLSSAGHVWMPMWPVQRHPPEAASTLTNRPLLGIVARQNGGSMPGQHAELSCVPKRQERSEQAGALNAMRKV